MLGSSFPSSKNTLKESEVQMVSLIYFMILFPIISMTGKYKTVEYYELTYILTKKLSKVSSKSTFKPN